MMNFKKSVSIFVFGFFANDCHAVRNYRNLQTFPLIAGYTPSSDVILQTNLDRDQKDMEDLLANDLAGAKNIYTNGKNALPFTIKGFSTNANVDMRVGGNISKSFYPDFQKFVTHYGVPDYADKFVIGGFDATASILGAYNFDFTLYSNSVAALGQIVRKGTTMLSFIMYVIGRLERSLDFCLSSQTSASLRSLDEAVAFYAGSLEGTEGGTAGILLYQMARRRCSGTKTCATFGNETSGNAKVNIDIFSLFTQMKASISSSNCAAAENAKKAIAKKIFIPPIQGALRYAYLQSIGRGTATGEAEGVAFISGVLPIIAACNTSSANVIFQEMKPSLDFTVSNYAALKLAFETNYPCMGITCADVGGYWNTTTSTYSPGAFPCTDPPPLAPTAPVAPPLAPTAPVASPSAPTAPVLPPAAPSAPTPTPKLPTTPPFAPVPVRSTPIRSFFQRIFDFFRNIFGF